MRLRHFLLLSLTVVLCACPCKKGNEDVENEPAELLWETSALSIIEQIAPDDSLCYQIDLTLDTLAGDSLLARNLAAVLRDSVLLKPRCATVEEAMKAFADSTTADWKAEIAERYDPESDFNQMLQFSYAVEGFSLKTNRDDILSYQVTKDYYLGGPHGIYDIHYYNFDKKSGKLVNIRDIVPADKEKEVLKQMEAQLLEDWDAKDVAELQEKTGILMLNDLFLTNNFLLKKDSIEFLFNQYEIAPYAAGLISVTIKTPSNSPSMGRN